MGGIEGLDILDILVLEAFGSAYEDDLEFLGLACLVEDELYGGIGEVDIDEDALPVGGFVEEDIYGAVGGGELVGE